MEWLKQHIVETGIGCALALLMWMSTQVTSLRTDVALINHAVNNVEADEKTLRELVEQIDASVAVIRQQIGENTQALKYNSKQIDENRRQIVNIYQQQGARG